MTDANRSQLNPRPPPASPHLSPPPPPLLSPLQQVADDPFESLLEFITPLWLSELSSRELRHALASRTLDGIARTSGYAAGAGGRENLQRSMEAKLRELDSKYYVENVRAAMPMFANSRPTTLALGIAQVRVDAQVREARME